MRRVVDSVEPLYFTLFFTLMKELVNQFSYQELLFNVVSTHINDTYLDFFKDKGVQFCYSRDFSDDGKKVSLLFEFFSVDSGYREIYKIQSSSEYVDFFGGVYV